MEENNVNNNLENNVTPTTEPVVEQPTPVEAPQTPEVPATPDVPVTPEATVTPVETTPAVEPVVEQPVVESQPAVAPVQETPVAPVQEQPVQVNPQPTGVVEQPVQPKKKSALPIILIIAFVFIIGIVVAVILLLPKQKKEKVIFDKTIDGLFSKVLNASKEADEIVNKKMKIDISKEPFHIDGKVNLSVSGLPTEMKEYEKLSDVTYGYDVTLDLKNKKMGAVLTADEKSKSLINLKALVEGKYAYVEEKNILGISPVKLDLGEDVFESFDLDENSSRINFGSFTNVVEKTSNYLKASVPADLLVISQEQLNGKKVNKTTLPLTNANIKTIYTNFYNYVIKDTDLLEDLSVLAGTSVDDLKKSLKETLDSLNEPQTETTTAEFSIYTDSSNKLVEIVLVADKEKVLDITNNDGVYSFKSKYLDDKYDITYNEKTNTFKLKFENDVLEVTYKDDNLSAKLTASGLELTLTIKTSSSADKFSSDIEVALKYAEDGATINGKLTATSNIDKTSKLPSINKSTAITSDQLDSTTIQNNITTNFSGTVFESFITSAVQSMQKPSYTNYGGTYGNIGNYSYGDNNYSNYSWIN